MLIHREAVAQTGQTIQSVVVQSQQNHSTSVSVTPPVARKNTFSFTENTSCNLIDMIDWHDFHVVSSPAHLLHFLTICSASVAVNGVISNIIHQEVS